MHALACLLLAVAAAMAPAETGDTAALSLTADEAVEQALRHNAELRSAAARAMAAAERAEAADRPEPIRLSLNPATILQQVTASISEVLGISKKRKYASRAARHELAAIVAAGEEFRLELIAATRATYWSLAAAERTLAVRGSMAEAAQELLAGTRELAAAGAAPESATLSAEMGLAEAQEDLARARSDRASLEVELARLIGEMPGRPIQAADALDPGPADLPALDVLIERALAQRPAVAEILAKAQAADAGIGLARSERRPEVGVGLEFDELDLFGALSLDYPLIDFGTIRHSVRARRWTAEAALTEAEVVRQDIRAEVADGLARLREATARHSSLRDDRLPKAEAALDGRAAEVEAGALPRVALPHARLARDAVVLDTIEAQRDLLLARTGLERAVGTPADGKETQ